MAIDMIARALSLMNAGITEVSSVNGRFGVVSLTKDDVNLSNVTNDSQVKRTEMGIANGVETLNVSGKLSHMPTSSDIGLGNVTNDAQIPLSQKGASNGVVPLNANGKVDLTYLTINGAKILGVTNTAARLALALCSDFMVAIEADTKNAYGINANLDPSISANWLSMGNVSSQVVSVNGKTGVVTLAKTDIGLDQVNNTSDANKPISTATQTALNNKLNIADSSTVLDWSASTVVRLGEVRKCTTSYGSFLIGQFIRSLSARTTGTTFGSTESAYWESLGSSGSGINTIQTLNVDGSPNAWFTTLEVDSSSSTRTITLLTASGNTGKLIEIKKVDNSSNVVCIKPYGSELLEGSTNPVYLCNKGESVVIRSDGYNDIIVADNRTTVFTQASYYYGAPTQGTVSTISDITPITLNFAGSDISLSDNNFTLKAGKTYLLEAYFMADFGAANGEIRINWADVSNVILGAQTVLRPTTYTYNCGTLNCTSHIITTTVDTIVKLRITTIVGTNTIYGAGMSRIKISVLSQSAPVINTMDYLNVARITSDVTGMGQNSDLIFNSIVSGNIPYNTTTGVATLSAGKTYELIGEPAFTSYSDATGGFNTIDWVDATTNVSLLPNFQSVGILVPSTRTVPECDNIEIHAIYTPTTNQTVKLRIILSYCTSTFRSNNGSKAIIRQIGSSAVNAVSLMTQVANLMYPVGHIEITENSANPSTYLGFGTWVQYGSGRVLIGAGTGTDTNGTQRAFSTTTTGGEYTHQLTIAEMPQHRHSFQNHSYTQSCGSGGNNAADETTGTDYTSYEGGNGYHSIIQPYITVYMWKRTA